MATTTSKPQRDAGPDDLEQLMAEVRRLRLLARRRVTDLFAGSYHAAFKGRGIEFAEVREYQPGDDTRGIDWNVTARAGRPFIKRFEEERQLTVTLALDISASGAFGTTGRTKARAAGEAAAIVAMTALDNNDRVGLLLFSDDTELYIPPRKGRNHLLRLLRELLGAAPRGRGAGLGDALDGLAALLRQRSIVFLFSDFAGPAFLEGADDTRRALAGLHQRHELVAVRVDDPAESRLAPAGLVEVVDPESGRRLLVDTSSGRVRRRLAEIAERERALAEGLIRRAGVDLIDIPTDANPADALARYFRLRERRRARE